MLGDLYRANHARVLDFVATRDPSVMVPACPAWSAADLLRHLTGLATDVVAGNVDGYGGDEWTDRQVSSRAELPVEDVLDEWRESTEPLAAMLDDLAGSGLPAVIDTATGPQKREGFAAAIIGDLLHHEFDLRNAYGDRQGRERPDVVMSAIGHAKALRPVFTTRRLPTLRIEIDGQPLDIGRDDPQAVLSMSAFETVRSIGGRRTLDEIRELDWTGARDRFVDLIVLPYMRPPATSIGER